MGGGVRASAQEGGAIAVSFSLHGSDTLGGQGKALKLDLTAGFGL